MDVLLLFFFQEETGSSFDQGSDLISIVFTPQDIPNERNNILLCRAEEVEVIVTTNQLYFNLIELLLKYFITNQFFLYPLLLLRFLPMNCEPIHPESVSLKIVPTLTRNQYTNFQLLLLMGKFTRTT